MNHCTIRNFEEGLVGKIVRYKSGKTKLVLGEARYDMDLGLNSGFIQVCKLFYFWKLSTITRAFSLLIGTCVCFY